MKTIILFFVSALCANCAEIRYEDINDGSIIGIIGIPILHNALIGGVYSEKSQKSWAQIEIVRVNGKDLKEKITLQIVGSSYESTIPLKSGEYVEFIGEEHIDIKRGPTEVSPFSGSFKDVADKYSVTISDKPSSQAIGGRFIKWSYIMYSGSAVKRD